jgi:hypothetical protein
MGEGLRRKDWSKSMSAIKRLIEDAAGLVHDGNREALEALLTDWDDSQKVALLMDAIALNRLICSCECEA